MLHSIIILLIQLLIGTSMLQDYHQDHKQPLTPKKTHRQSKYSSQDEHDYSIDSPLYNKTYSVPSTIDSPIFVSSKLTIYKDIDSTLEFEVESEAGEKCYNFHLKGFCDKGESCSQQHWQALDKKRIKRLDIFANFPEFIVLSRLGRSRSFLQ